MIEIVLLAFASALWPALIAVVVIALRSPNPVQLLSGFWAGGLLTTIAIGSAIALTLQDSNIVTSDRSSTDPAVDITVGILMFVLAYVIDRLGHKDPSKRKPKKQSGPSLTERMLQRGFLLAFVAGIVLNVMPGFLPFVALKDIAELNYGTSGTIATVAIFYAIMFSLVEVPLLGYLISPTRTAAAVSGFNDWLNRNGRRLAVLVACAFGVYLIVRGVISLIG